MTELKRCGSCAKWMQHNGDDSCPLERYHDERELQGRWTGPSMERIACNKYVHKWICAEETAKGDNFAEYIVNVVDDMFHCSNYEKCEVTSYANGGYADE